ncbi:hypothetical protein LOZ65_004683 [Ophidiomyces ophidiicola]|nr:hypothetical protein LOZ65_004683 [Ophidiomyces ophidiicola]
MSLPKEFFFANEELGKKYDDHYDKPARLRRPAMQSWRLPRRRRVYALIIGVLLCYIIFTHTSYIRSEEVTTEHESSGYLPPVHSRVSRPNTPPPVPNEARERNDHYFNGPIRFYTLTKSLYSIHGFVGYNGKNKIVLFAAANLKSLSNLLPLACQMSANRLNRVHIALMGREDISIEGIQKVNNYHQSECPIVWHDARPDYGQYSTDARMEISVNAALSHISSVLRPRIIITHDSRDENFLIQGVKTSTSKPGITHIGLQGRVSDFEWIARLDSKALAAWNAPQIEVLVHAPPASSGSLLRLLKSLKQADYFGAVPGLTIELPFDADASLLEYLSGFTWPPHTSNRHFTLRRRISHKLGAQEAAIRNIDAVYPRHPWHSHVLVLSPQTELSPSFYHFIHYSLLKYRYSIGNESSDHQLLGVSLELPSTRPTDGRKFSPPKMETASVTNNQRTLPIFLWQVPNSNAALYFGDKWIEFQSFLSRRLSPSRSEKKTQFGSLPNKFPSWMDYMVEFILIRGYYLLYPAFSAEDGLSLATVHNELFHIPEEHDDVKGSVLASQQKNIDSHAQTIVRDPAPPTVDSTEKALSSSSSISDLLLEFPGHFPNLTSLDILSPSGAKVYDFETSTQAYITKFMVGIGGCDSDSQPSEFVPMSSDDLFCSHDER